MKHPFHNKRAKYMCSVKLVRSQKKRVRQSLKFYSQRRRLKRFGLSQTEYDQRSASQAGACAICRKFERIPGRALSIDHDHETNKIRGLLCSRCNRVLGLAEDSPLILQSMIAYLQTNKI